MVVGVAEEWGLESHLFGFRPQRIAQASACSLLLVRKHGGYPPGHDAGRHPEQMPAPHRAKESTPLSAT